MFNGERETGKCITGTAIFSSFGWNWVATQGFTLAKQVLYCLSQ
jgi:hypothetical protein